MSQHWILLLNWNQGKLGRKRCAYTVHASGPLLGSVMWNLTSPQ